MKSFTHTGRKEGGRSEGRRGEEEGGREESQEGKDCDATCRALTLVSCYVLQGKLSGPAAETTQIPPLHS